MNTFLRLLLLVLMSFSALAADVRYNGVKPDFIIDVRTAEEFSAGHIDGAINLPVDQIGQRLSGIKGLRPGSTVLVYCRSGRRSSIAQDSLRALGYRNVSNGGGYEQFSQALNTRPLPTCSNC